LSEDPQRPGPWWIPSLPVGMALGLYALTWWLLWMLAPARGQEPSELFKLLAQAVVLTAFVNGAVGALYVASRDGQNKNDTIATQARVLADQSAAGRASSSTPADPPPEEPRP
jgi:hypothetical protein